MEKMRSMPAMDQTFRSRELTDYFATKTWYYGSIARQISNSAVFNTYENTNIKFLTDAEKCSDRRSRVMCWISRAMTFMPLNFRLLL